MLKLKPNTLATWCKEPAHWQRPWGCEKLKAGGEGGNRVWDFGAGWHHWLNGHEFEQALGDGEGQGSLEHCGPCCHKETDTTWRLNNSSNKGLHSPNLVSYGQSPNLETRISGPVNIASGGFLTVPPLVSNCLNLPFGTQGRHGAGILPTSNGRQKMPPCLGTPHDFTQFTHTSWIFLKLIQQGIF